MKYAANYAQRAELHFHNQNAEIESHKSTALGVTSEMERIRGSHQRIIDDNIRLEQEKSRRAMEEQKSAIDVEHNALWAQHSASLTAKHEAREKDNLRKTEEILHQTVIEDKAKANIASSPIPLLGAGEGEVEASIPPDNSLLPSPLVDNICPLHHCLWLP